MWEGRLVYRKPYHDFEGCYEAVFDASREMEDIAMSLEQGHRVWPWDLPEWNYEMGPLPSYLKEAGYGEPYTIRDVLNEKMIKWLLRYDKRQFLKLAPESLSSAVEDYHQRVRQVLGKRGIDA